MARCCRVLRRPSPLYRVISMSQAQSRIAPLASTACAPKQVAQLVKDPSELFHYSSGRWVYNDSLRHDERKRFFDVSELKRLAAESVRRIAEDVVSFDKLAEGGFNRTFTIGMRDGFRLVARIPYPLVTPKPLVVASEAATMGFLRTHGIPVPLIYAYSATAENASGTEYMFMEFIRGTNLGDAWFDMTEDDRLEFITSLVDLEARLFALRLPASGSLYYAKDLPATMRTVPVSATDSNKEMRFCVGPDTSIPLWFGRRSSIAVDRGPYTEPGAVLTASAEKETAYLQAFGRPLHPFPRIRRETFGYEKQQPSVHLETLRKYRLMAPYLIPRNDTLTWPMIRHPDLQPNNIFVSENFDVISLIDWQHCPVRPRFLHCGIPPSLENFSDPVSQSLETPRLPDRFESMSEEEQAEQAELLRTRQLHHFYVTETARRNPAHLDALMYDHSAARRRLYEQSCNPWEGDNVTLKSGLIHMAQKWRQVTGSLDPCLVFFTPDEERECLRLEAEQREGDAQMTTSKEILGIGPQGWVPSEHYSEVKASIAAMKADMIRGAENETDRDRIREHWIYDDMDEDEYL